MNTSLKCVVFFLLLGVTLLSFNSNDEVRAQDYSNTVAQNVFPSMDIGTTLSDIQGIPTYVTDQFFSGLFPDPPSVVGAYEPLSTITDNYSNLSLPSTQNINTTFNWHETQVFNGQYQILGDVTGSIPIGNSMYDSIPILENPSPSTTPKLPVINIPQNDNEFINRVDALAVRFTKLPLSIQYSTPARLLRYSLVGGADQTFLAPENVTVSTDYSNLQSPLKPMYAIGALCWNYPCANRTLLRLVDNRPSPTVGIGFQSQRGEFLATLAFARIDRNYELRIGEKKFTVQDLVEWEKYSCTSYSNLSLVAVGLAHYSHNPDETWFNASGEIWSLARILEQESQRPIDWETAESTNKLLAFTYLLARLKLSDYANSPQLSEALNRTERFLIAVKARVWEIFGEHTLSNSLFFKTNVKLTTPYMAVYVNGKILRWMLLVSSDEEIESQRMKKAMYELCGLVDQLYNSVQNLDLLSPIDEESLVVAMQTLILFRKHLTKQST